MYLELAVALIPSLLLTIYRLFDDRFVKSFCLIAVNNCSPPSGGETE